MDAHFEMPTEAGAYWYWCERRQLFRVCEVLNEDGQIRATFTDGSFQRFCGGKSYFVGPIHPPVITSNGKIVAP